MGNKQVRKKQFNSILPWLHVKTPAFVSFWLLLLILGTRPATMAVLAITFTVLVTRQCWTYQVPSIGNSKEGKKLFNSIVTCLHDETAAFALFCDALFRKMSVFCCCCCFWLLLSRLWSLDIADHIRNHLWAINKYEKNNSTQYYHGFMSKHLLLSLFGFCFSF